MSNKSIFPEGCELPKDLSPEEINKLIQEYNTTYAPMALIDNRLSQIAAEAKNLEVEMGDLSMKRQEMVHSMTRDLVRIFAIIAKHTSMPVVPNTFRTNDGDFNCFDIDKIARVLEALKK